MVYWLIEVRREGRWVPKGGSKRRRYYSEEQAELKAREYRDRHPRRDVRVRKITHGMYAGNVDRRERE